MKQGFVAGFKIILWIVLILAYFAYFVASSTMPLSLQTNWFSKNAPVDYDFDCGMTPGICGRTVETIDYKSVGFPIQTRYSAAEQPPGPFIFTWTINLGYMALVGTGLGFLLFGKYKKAAIVAALLVAVYLALYLVTDRTTTV